MCRVIAATFLLTVAALFVFATQGSVNFRFVILGDRTGGAQPGVFEEATRAAMAAHPDFVITVGDAIEGGKDAETDSQWEVFLGSIAPHSARLPIFFTPGNHDIWSPASERAFERFAKHPPHYSFDFDQAHFTILDNSRTEQFSAGEISYLEEDLAAHSAQPVKFVFSHRPSWIFQALLGDRKSVFQEVAKKYHVQYFIAGHIHQMLYFRVDDVNYISMPSSGGHLRDNQKYENGWFFAETEVDIRGTEASFKIHELQSPFGEGRISEPTSWGAAGLVSAARAASESRR